MGLVASALLGLREEFKEENSEKLFTLSASDIAGYLIEDIIERLKTEEEKYGIICSVIENVDITGLGIMARLNYDKQDNISDTTKYEDHFVAENRLIAISKSGRSMDSEDVQNFLNATERGIDVQLFVRKNKDDKISKEFYYLGRVIATGNAKQFVMPNTDKTAVEIEWELETPVREDIYQYIVNE